MANAKLARTAYGYNNFLWQAQCHYSEAFYRPLIIELDCIVNIASVK